MTPQWLLLIRTPFQAPLARQTSARTEARPAGGSGHFGAGAVFYRVRWRSNDFRHRALAARWWRYEHTAGWHISFQCGRYCPLFAAPRRRTKCAPCWAHRHRGRTTDHRIAAWRSPTTCALRRADHHQAAPAWLTGRLSYDAVSAGGCARLHPLHSHSRGASPLHRQPRWPGRPADFHPLHAHRSTSRIPTALKAGIASGRPVTLPCVRLSVWTASLLVPLMGSHGLHSLPSATLCRCAFFRAKR